MKCENEEICNPSNSDSYKNDENRCCYNDAVHGEEPLAEGRDTASEEFISVEDDINTSTNISIMQIQDLDEGYPRFFVNKDIILKIPESFSASYPTDTIFIGSCDYAELFETVDGCPIEVGYFVTLDGEKIRKALSHDEYVLGVTSAIPGILGNSNDFEWKNKYLKDEWGKIQYREIRTPVVVNRKGKVTTVESIERFPIINPEWDKTKNYIPRISRPEWVAVGLLGKILVRDDGSCHPGGYCKPNDDGVATASDKGYRVIRRTMSGQIMILFR